MNQLMLSGSVIMTALPVMLFGVAVAVIMRSWVWKVLRKHSLDPKWGNDYAVLNPDGLVLWFEFRLAAVIFCESGSVLSAKETRWLLFYGVSRILTVLASLLMVVAKISVE